MAKNDPTEKDPNRSADEPFRDEEPQSVDEAADSPPTGQSLPESDAIDRALADEVAAETAQLRADLDEAKDRELRARAELENVKKRAAREIADERRYANLPLIGDLLPMLDNMARAIEAAERSREVDALLEGFQMVARQFHDVLARHHCTEIEALGQPFDPHRHEAVCQQISEDSLPNTVVAIAQPGFQLHDRVIRPSKVIVSMKPAGGDAEKEDD